MLIGQHTLEYWQNLTRIVNLSTNYVQSHMHSHAPRKELEPMKAMEPIWTNIVFYWTGLSASFNKEDSSFCQAFIILFTLSNPGALTKLN